MAQPVTAPGTVEFDIAGKPKANPTYLVDPSSGIPLGSSANPVQTAGGGGGTQYTDGSAAPTHPIGTELVFNNAGTMTATSLTNSFPVGIYQGANEATVAAFHSNDNTATGSGFGLLTGGVAQILNPAGFLDRQRGTGFDGITGVGIATGTQQLTGPALTTTFNGAVTGSPTFQTITVASTGSMKAGDMLVTQDNVEYCEVLAVLTGTTFRAILQNNHANGQSLTWYHYNQARDATVGDSAALTGMGASATYLYNNISMLLEFARTANGERDGASGVGTNIAAEYEYNGGGPLTNAGLASGLTFDRGRSLQSKGVGSATQNAGGAAGATSITVSSAAATNSLQPGQQIRIDRHTGTEECAYVATNYTSGTAAITLQSALQFSHTAAPVEWDVFSPNGPGTNGFTAVGVGIEEEAIYNPADGKHYIERSATADGMAAANIVADGPSLFNGTTYDRRRAVSGDAQAATGLATEVVMLWNGTTYDRLKGTSGAALMHSDSIGQTTTAIAAATSTNTVVKASAGSLGRILITATGSVEMDVYDNASTTSGTKIAAIPSSATIGQIFDIQMPAANGITVGGNAGNPGVTISYT